MSFFRETLLQNIVSAQIMDSGQKQGHIHLFRSQFWLSERLVSNFSAMVHGFPSMIIHEIMAWSWNDSRHGGSMNHGWKSMNGQPGEFQFCK